MNSKKLYHFLMNNECHLYKDRNSQVIAWVAVCFCDLDEFVKIVGVYPFEESGLDVVMFKNYIAVEINNIIEGTGDQLCEYEECFGDEWKQYFEE